MSIQPARPFAELADSGLLWLVNAAVFHPRGYALALVRERGEVTGWTLLGNGSEPWRFGDDCAAEFAAANRTLGGPS
jgi:hypothetical protein